MFLLRTDQRSALGMKVRTQADMMLVQQICFAQMAQEATKLDHLHEIENIGEHVTRLEQTIVDGDQAGFAPDTESGQGPAGIAQHCADFGGNHCGGVGQYPG